MRLNEPLKICLLALDCRHPRHVIDFNEDVVMLPGTEIRGWRAGELMALLKQEASHMLDVPATLLIDESRAEIYLPHYSDQLPAFYVHCRGLIPACNARLGVYAGSSVLRMN
jgi:hypothetical protein